MKANANFQIIEFLNPSGEKVFRVNGMKTEIIGGRAVRKQIRRNFPTIQEATGEKQRLENEALNLPSTPLRSTQLSAAQVGEAETAFSLLGGRPLTAAVRFYLDHWKEPVTPISIRESFEKFLATKAAENNRPLTIRNLQTRVSRLVNRQPDRMVGEIQPEELREMIFQPGRSAVTADNDRRALSSFFTWATKQGHCRDNPAANIDPIKKDRDEPEILPLEAVRKLMAAAAAYKDGATLPYTALGLFCAIRPTELARIGWKDIDIEGQTVTIGAKVAKMRQRRIVAISDNCLEWLLPHAAKHAPIKGINWRRDFDAVKEAAGYGEPTKKKPGLKGWTQDLMRHTGISHHLAQHEHEGKTAAWAGNSPDMVQRHYKGLVKKSDAAKFWTITPGDKKIITLPAAS